MADLPMVALAALFIATPALLAVAVDIQVRAFQREARRGRLAYAVARAGNDGDFSFQS